MTTVWIKYFPQCQWLYNENFGNNWKQKYRFQRFPRFPIISPHQSLAGMVHLCQALIHIIFTPLRLLFIRVFELSDAPKGHLSPDVSVSVGLCSAVRELGQVLIIQSTKGSDCFYPTHCALLWQWKQHMKKPFKSMFLKYIKLLLYIHIYDTIGYIIKASCILSGWKDCSHTLFSFSFTFSSIYWHRAYFIASSYSVLIASLLCCMPNCEHPWGKVNRNTVW